eukprot:TRINITY_DN448_c0_g1_i2.p1 TRINITY_DN448_c0_g1~~TRINITY_DN448_c0_g1_i2.p1  ORF type:complete len:160 (-),score=53.30 TRINITY_DN448_c0_g1_i2:14-493(-)
MKTTSTALLLAVLSVVLLSSVSTAQTVSITSSDASVNEDSASPATFTVTRDGTSGDISRKEQQVQQQRTNTSNNNKKKVARKMKTTSTALLLAVLSVVLLSSVSTAQTVSITSSDASVNEDSASPATFTVTRDGTSGDLAVTLTFSGDAVSGTDFSVSF